MQLGASGQVLVGDTGNVVLVRAIVALVTRRAPNGVWSVQALTTGPAVTVQDGLHGESQARQGVQDALTLIAPQLTPAGPPPLDKEAAG